MIVTGNNELEKFLKNLPEGEKVSVYAGIDPTGDLHIGHLGFLRILSLFKEEGHDVNIILGTGTAFIGDPTGKNSIRKMLNESDIEKHTKSIKEDISSILGDDFNFIRNDWLKVLNFQTFMRDVGSKIPLNDILNLSMVKNRLEKGNGITLMEAIYPVMQGYDMVVMAQKAKEKGIKKIIQTGGADQYTNVSFGIHLVNRLVEGIEAICILSDLIVSPSGEKMGKTTSNALYINRTLTDDILFYDSIISMPDSVIPSMVSVLAPWIDTTQDIIKIKKILAISITGWIRGEDSVLNIMKIKEQGINSGNIEECVFDKDISIVKILKETNLVDSFTEARKLIKNKGVKINNAVIEEDFIISEPLEFILSKGKKNHRKIKIL